EIAVPRNVDVGGQRRSADGAQVDGQLLMASNAKSTRDDARRFHFARVPLAIGNREGVQRKAVSLRDRRGRVRVEASAEEDDGRPHTPRVDGCQMNLWSW